jgi:hypothetical protein
VQYMVGFQPHKLQLRKQGLAFIWGQPQKNFILDLISVDIRWSELWTRFCTSARRHYVGLWRVPLLFQKDSGVCPYTAVLSVRSWSQMCSTPSEADCRNGLFEPYQPSIDSGKLFNGSTDYEGSFIWVTLAAG